VVHPIAEGGLRSGRSGDAKQGNEGESKRKQKSKLVAVVDDDKRAPSDVESGSLNTLLKKSKHDQASAGAATMEAAKAGETSPRLTTRQILTLCLYACAFCLRNRSSGQRIQQTQQTRCWALGWGY
jgi:hypothetical protein